MAQKGGRKVFDMFACTSLADGQVQQDLLANVTRGKTCFMAGLRRHQRLLAAPRDGICAHVSVQTLSLGQAERMLQVLKEKTNESGNE